MSKGRVTYEVRIRVAVGPEKWVKKSKFYQANNPGDAASKYKGPGHIMSVEKVKKEQLLGGVGEFFRMGDALLKELSTTSPQEQIKERVRKRRDHFERQRHSV